MSNYFTHYWKNETWERERRTYQKGEPLEHTANDEFCAFRNHCVNEGDYVYVVTVRKGVLHLIGKIHVINIETDQIEAENQLGYDLWAADKHIVGESCIPMAFDRCVSSKVAKTLEFESPSGPKPLKFVTNGKLDRQTLRGWRGVRQLTPDSAELLDKSAKSKTPCP